MRKYIPYIVGIVLVSGLIVLFLTGNKNKPQPKKRVMDETLTLRRQDKIPYGTYVAFQNLGYILPKAKLFIEKKEPGSWDSISVSDKKQAIIIISHSFNADSWECRKLINFVRNGNDVFISSRYLSAAAERIFGCVSNATELDFLDPRTLVDSMKISLNDPPFIGPSTYKYPGRSFGIYLMDVNKSTAKELGRDEKGHANFIHLKAGDGNLFIHTEPLAFSNFFILHQNNHEYYEKALSVISPGTERVLWDEYYLTKKESNTRNNDDSGRSKDWFRTLMNLRNDAGQRPFLPAFWLMIFLLILFVLLGMRRKQRHIPFIHKPVNDSLDFVKTIGRLYYDRGDHRNLCRKMGAYFLEYVRNKYKLSTSNLDDHFVMQLKFKTGLEESEIRGIVSFIKYLDDAPMISSPELLDFHRQLESFYKKA